MTEALPSYPEEITPQWLSEALSSAGEERRARSVEVVDAHSGTTGRARIRVTWENAGDAPEAIFVKLPPSDPTSREMVVATGMGRREAQFYRKLSAQVSVRVPEVHWSVWSDDGTSYLMLLEDLVESGCRFPAGDDPLLLEYTRSLVASLAQLHAQYWNSPRFANDLSWVEGPLRHEWGRILVKAGLESFGSEMPDAFGKLAELYIGQTRAFDAVLDRGTHTLIHGDAHLGNLFLDGDRVGFLDWACFARAPGMRDVAYFLCNSLPTELRRAEERDLLLRYQRALDAAGAPTRPFDSIWRDYRRFAAYSWVAATTTAAAGSRMQSVAVGRRALQRSNAAIEDLGTLPLLFEELDVRSGG